MIYRYVFVYLWLRKKVSSSWDAVVNSIEQLVIPNMEQKQYRWTAESLREQWRVEDLHLVTNVWELTEMRKNNDPQRIP